MKNKKLLAWMLAAALTASALAAPVYTAQAQETNGTEVVDAEGGALDEAAEDTFTEVGQTIKVEGQKSGESREFTLECEETGEYIIRYTDTGNISESVSVKVHNEYGGYVHESELIPIAEFTGHVHYEPEASIPVSLDAGMTYIISITPTNEEENVNYELYFGTEPEVVDIKMNYDSFVVESGGNNWWGINGFPFVVTYSDGSVQHLHGPRAPYGKNEIEEEIPFLPYDDYGNYFILELKDESQRFYFDFLAGGDYPITITVNGNEQMVFEEVINISDPSGKYDGPVIVVVVKDGTDSVRYECGIEKQEVTLKELFPDGIPVQEKEGYELIGWYWFGNYDKVITETDTIFIEGNWEAFSLEPVYREISSGENGGGTPSEPSVPSEPTEPEEPSEPSEPTTPDEPTEPEEPTTPDEPSEPSEPTEPEEPTTPDEPIEPEEPSEPSEPTVPEEPTTPDEPTEPEEPSEPSEPTVPEEPIEPEEPSEPTTPDEPTEPEEPSVPSEPTEPDEPSEPEKPSVPDNFVYDVEVFEQLLKTQDVVVKPNDYVTITFAKGAAKEVSGKSEYDFSAAIVWDYNSANLPSYISKDSFISAIDYAYSGELPAEASIEIFVGTKYAGEQVYYFLLKEDNTYAEVQAVTVDADGYITVTQNHCSKYVITTQNPQASADTNPSTDKIPQTGDTNPILPYTMLFAAGVIAIVSKKRLVND